MTKFNKVGDFHELFEHPKFTTQNTEIFTKTPELVNLRVKLIDEEFEELKEAIDKQDLVEVADALSDMLYVIYGAGHVFGINLNNVGEYDDIFDHLQNLPLNLLIFNKKNLLQLRLSLIEVAFNHFKQSVNDHNFKYVENSLGDLLFAVFGTGYAFGINLNKTFNAVHESNMTKACKNENEAIETVEYLKQTQPRYNPDYKLSVDKKYYIVYDKNTNKILKNKYYKPVDLTIIY
jgi:predicted HAD superfamily Cof-like phosphohydrolase